MTAKTLNRRVLLGGAGLGMAAASLSAKAAPPAKPDPLITEIQDWNRHLGDGVVSRPMASPRTLKKAWSAAMSNG